MRYLKYTYVDAITGVAITQTPASNGPKPPDVPGLAFGFALESQYPTLTPIFYGTCWAEARIDMPGVLGELTRAEYDAARAEEINAQITKARAQAMARINAHYTKLTSVLEADYPENEQKSWSLQSTEAAIVLGADDLSTPWIDSSAAKEGVTRVELATRIAEMDAAYRTIHGELSAIRRILRDQIASVPANASALLTLNAIAWPLDGPGMEP